MGNGFGAVLGYKKAAYHRDIGIGLENGAGPGLVNFGGLGNASGIPFSFTDPKGGTYDFCCSTAKQNGVVPDSQCPNSQLTNVCP
jgi:hypothetical protein